MSRHEAHDAYGYDDDARHPAPPSFEPWIGRIQMARAWSATLGMVIITLLTANAGTAWDGAILRGLAAAIVMYFVGWVSALFICGELYAVQVRQARAEASAREAERRARITEMYQQQLAQHRAAAEPDDLLTPQGTSAAPAAPRADAMATTPLRPVPNSATAADTDPSRMAA